MNIRYATFNIRYDNPVDSLNNWKYRKDRVCKFIMDKGLEIVGMQEVLYNQLEDLKDGLPGYSAIGVGREDGKDKENMHLCFIVTIVLKCWTVILSGCLNILIVPDL